MQSTIDITVSDLTHVVLFITVSMFVDKENIDNIMKFKLNDVARIQNEDRFKQPLLFEGMNIGKMYPTDIDALTEYHNWFFIIMEVKGKDVPLNQGQTLALQRLVDTIEDAGKIAVLYICRHSVEDNTQPVFLKDTIVTEAYYNREWQNVIPITAGKEWFDAMEWAMHEEKEGRR